jgi:hypothetical protein
MKSLIDNEVQEQVTSEVEKNAKKTTKKHAKGKKGKGKKKKSKKSKKPTAATLVAQKSPYDVNAKLDRLGITRESNDFDAKSQPVVVPVDELNAITLKVSPQFSRDKVESVTLKSFRKVIGYDTFDAIRRGDRDEVKDPTDHYNVTISLMV